MTRARRFATPLACLAAWAAGSWPPAVAAGVYPEEAEARAVLAESPVLRAAREFIAQGAADNRLRKAGSHEWVAGTTSRRRTDAVGMVYTEQEYSLARGWRLPGKRSLDLQIGAQAEVNGEYAYEDAWHEAARTLLAGWFTWLRAEYTAAQRAELRDQHQRLLQSVNRRVQAGDAPALEARLAEAELQRSEASLYEGRQEVLAARTALQKSYPTLTLNLPASLPDPVEPAESDAIWTERIVSSNHEIKLADGLRERSQLEASRAWRERLPDPTLGVSFSDNVDGNRRLYILTLSMPLGGTARSAAAAAAASRARAAGAEAEAATLRVQGDARQDLASWRNSYARWRNLGDAAAQARDMAAAYERGYVNGEFTLVELHNAQQVAGEARLTATLAHLEALEADARLRIDAHRLWTPD